MEETTNQSLESVTLQEFTLDRIKLLLARKEMPEINEISLSVLQAYFEQEIMPYKYKCECNNNLMLEFNLKESEFCHLLFGSVDYLGSKSDKYKGIKGYENVKNGTVTMDNLPKKVKDYAKFRLKAFIFLPFLLNNPKAIYFNQKIVPQNTTIPAEFLLYKELNTIKMHLFIKTVNQKRNILSCISFFHNEDDKYIRDQIGLRLVNTPTKTKIG